MRLYLNLTPNKETVPFNYQEKLVGAFHAWLGNANSYHSDTSFYSLSWLSNGKRQGNGLVFTEGTTWFISAADENLLKQLIKGIQQKPEIAFGLKVNDVMIQETPVFSETQRFMTASPVLIKSNVPGKKQQFYYFTDAESGLHLTRTLQYKLGKAGLPADNVSVAFDTSFTNARIKKITYKGIDNKGSICPVIVKGTPQQVAFVWNTGVGNSTGIGFGALI